MGFADQIESLEVVWNEFAHEYPRFTRDNHRITDVVCDTHWEICTDVVKVQQRTSLDHNRIY
jgi:hypothetical protein